MNLALATNTKRLFVGIPIPLNLTESLCAFRQKHKDAKGIRWVQRENLHLTICFIGNINPNRLDEIIGNTKKVLRDAEPFALMFEKLCLAPAGKPYMIWAQFEQNEYFRELATDTCRILIPGQPVRKNPVPHITLARFNKPSYSGNIDLNIQIENGEIQVKEFALWESIQIPKGVIYNIIERFTL